MRKQIIILLSVLLMLSVGAVHAEQGGVLERVIGEIIEIGEADTYLFQTQDGQEIWALTDEETDFFLDFELSVGDVVLVEYNGIMTRSQPPQIMAQAIHCATLEGQVLDVDTENGRILVGSLSSGEIWASLPEGLDASEFAEQYARVYTYGLVALSEPAQTAAIAARVVFALEGEIIELNESYLLLRDWDGEETQVNHSAQSKISGELTIGDTVEVIFNGIATFSLPPQVFAISVTLISG